MIWCIGKNYRRHADEVGMGVDEYPEVFAKGANAVQDPGQPIRFPERAKRDRKSTRLNSSHSQISYAVFCLKKKKQGKRATEWLCSFLVRRTTTRVLRPDPLRG